MLCQHSRKAFTLVELSIVLVILGLLIGGVLTGQSLIRAAELRSVTTESTRYMTAVHTFRDKYFAIPGDMTNATAYWGKDDAACTSHTGNAMTPGTCNGNGNSNIGWGSTSNGTGEMFQFWKQLALSGLIEGTYSGLAGPNISDAEYKQLTNTNAPFSKISQARWSMRYYQDGVSTGLTYFSIGEPYRNILFLGGMNGSNDPTGRIIKPDEMYNIDMKVDDGMPGTGKLMPRQWSQCTTAATSTDLSAAYNLSYTSTACALMFRMPF